MRARHLSPSNCSADFRALRVAGAVGPLHPSALLRRVENGTTNTIVPDDWYETMCSHKKTRRFVLMEKVVEG